MKHRTRFQGIGALIGLGILIFDSRTALAGAREGIMLCIQTVIPTLLPFFLLSAVIMDTFFGCRGVLLNPIGRLFLLPEGAETILIPAFLGGYPVGARAVADAFQNDQLEQKEAERMLSFCNNPGPAFLFGMGGALFSDSRIPWILWGVLILSALAVSRMLPSTQYRPLNNAVKAPRRDLLNRTLKTMAGVCGWIILLRVVIAFCNRWFLWLFPDPLRILFIGLLELSNGCAVLSDVRQETIRFLMAGIIFAFGGICVTMQTAAVTAGLSIKKYLLGKLLHTLCTLVFSFCVLSRKWVLLALIIATIFIFPVKIKNSGSIPRKAIV